MEIIYLDGDAANPRAKGPKIIAHIVNDLGKWGRGFVMALSSRWPHVREEYLAWAALKGTSAPNPEPHRYPPFEPGEVQFVQAAPHVIVANMLAQAGIRSGSGPPPIRYEALEQALATTAKEARKRGASLHMPRIGTGTWEKVEPIIRNTMFPLGVAVTVYDLKE